MVRRAILGTLIAVAFVATSGCRARIESDQRRMQGVSALHASLVAFNARSAT